MSSSEVPDADLKLILVLDREFQAERFEKGVDRGGHLIVSLRPSQEVDRDAIARAPLDGNRVLDLKASHGRSVLIAIHARTSSEFGKGLETLRRFDSFAPHILSGAAAIECWRHSQDFKNRHRAHEAHGDGEWSRESWKDFHKQFRTLQFVGPLLKSRRDQGSMEELFMDWLGVSGDAPPAPPDTRHQSAVLGWLRSYLIALLAEPGSGGPDRPTDWNRLPLRTRLDKLLGGIRAPLPPVIYVDDQAYETEHGDLRHRWFKQCLGDLIGGRESGVEERTPRVIVVGKEDLRDSWVAPESFSSELETWLQDPARSRGEKLLESDLNVLLWVFDFVLFDEGPPRGLPSTAQTVIRTLPLPGTGLSWIHVASQGWQDLHLADLVGATGGLFSNRVQNTGPGLFTERPPLPLWERLHAWGRDLEELVEAPLKKWSEEDNLIVPPYLSMVTFLVRRLEYYPNELWERACRVLRIVFCDQCRDHQGQSRSERIRKAIGDASLFKYDYKRLEKHAFWKRVLENYWNMRRTHDGPFYAAGETDDFCRLTTSSLGADDTYHVIDDLSPALAELEDTAHLSARSTSLVFTATERLAAAVPAADRIQLCKALFEHTLE